MILKSGLIKKLKQEQRKILQREGLEKEFRRVNRLFKRELEAEVYIYIDSCPEFYNGPIYVAEVIRDLPDGLLFVTTAPSVDSLLRKLEEYFDE